MRILTVTIFIINNNDMESYIICHSFADKVLCRCSNEIIIHNIGHVMKINIELQMFQDKCQLSESVLLILWALIVMQFNKYLCQRILSFFCTLAGMYLDEQCAAAKGAVREDV